MIDKDTLETRRVYRVRSRNLTLAVWDGKGFLGIREKFDYRYLFTEYLNTVSQAEATNDIVPEEVELIEGKSEDGYFKTYKPLFEYLDLRDDGVGL